MAGYPEPTIKVVMGGAIDGDIWRTTYDLACHITGTPLNTELNALATQLITLFQTDVWVGSLKAKNAASINLGRCDVYFYPTGSSVATESGMALLGTADPGTGAGLRLPSRTAVVASKHTPFSGRQNRGRMYLPVTNTGLVPSGQLTTGDATSISQQVALHFRHVNAITAWSSSVTSQTVVVSSANRTTTAPAVSSVSVDTLPDTQRRRTNKDVAIANIVTSV